MSIQAWRSGARNQLIDEAIVLPGDGLLFVAGRTQATDRSTGSDTNKAPTIKLYA